MSLGLYIATAFHHFVVVSANFKKITSTNNKKLSINIFHLMYFVKKNVWIIIQALFLTFATTEIHFFFDNWPFFVMESFFIGKKGRKKNRLLLFA